MQELYGEQLPPLDRELLRMQLCSFQQLHREQQPPASNLPTALGTSAPNAPAGSAGCAASTASSSAQKVAAEEESPELDLGLAIEKMIQEIRSSLPVKPPSAQGNINVGPESPREDTMNRAAAEEASSGTESCGNSSPEPEEPAKPVGEGDLVSQPTFRMEVLEDAEVMDQKSVQKEELPGGSSCSVAASAAERKEMADTNTVADTDTVTDTENARAAKPVGEGDLDSQPTFKMEVLEDAEETNLLGRDLQVQLGVGVIPKDGKMVVHIMKLTQGDIQEINPEVWATEGKYGCLDIPPIKIEMQKDTPAIRVKQYPMSPEGKKGLASVIEHLLKENILEPCMSPHNTPILAIKKDEGKFRLVQDLREINKRTIARHPVVPNPYTLLSKIPREHTWFTVIDLKDAFWACPLAEECRDWFAFEWEHPDRGRKQQLRWTRLPQGYTESPKIFGQAIETLLEQFSPKEGVQILQYVDDLLISGETEKEVKDVIIQLLNFFGEKGLKVSQSKLQFVETEVTYLGHIIGKGSKRLSPARISGIVSISPPKTKRDIRKLLGLLGYCKH
ncbi:hypothetical protein DUI87_34464 [Hirundo rustica rustica]|uniref:ribonuclease H n=1 Tax=Hirundo rustica rustica TaxID=333673 RepID=A0A3M0IK55_HIRRU|nr:hypothetical protein DUI87_34464 [Hirundo rustica rustica]